MSNLIVFDLDGVITSEEAYWDAAGLSLHELMYSPLYWHIPGSSSVVNGAYQPAQTSEESRRISREVFPLDEVLVLKAHAINSNWDTCYSTVCLHLIELLRQLPQRDELWPLRPWDEEWLVQLRTQVASLQQQAVVSGREAVFQAQEGHPGGVSLHFDSHLVSEKLALPVFQDYVGLDVINRFDVYASQVLHRPVEDVFSRHTPFWKFCQNIFQEWYLGDAKYTEIYGHPPAQHGKPGCIDFEQLLLPVDAIRSTLEQLKEQGYTLGVATGRARLEALAPLEINGLLSLFDQQRLSTYDYVVRAEAQLRAKGDTTLLGKPHAFQFLQAANPRYEHVNEWEEITPLKNFIVVGDSTSDILGGRAAGAITVAVLTGARSSEARELLAKAGPDFTIEDVTRLPELLQQIDSLSLIQRLQFTEKEKAERLLQRWFARHMHLQTDSVTLTPKAVSLNSFNGFYRVGTEEYFFKTHVEEQGVLEEYYHAEQLYQAGYNIVRPLQTLHEDGQQMVIYPVVRWPVMFDLMRSVEKGEAAAGMFEVLVAAERSECEQLLKIYTETLAYSSAEEHAQAPIHQLFWHRLTGGRLKSFYTGKTVKLPDAGGQGKEGISFEELCRLHWTINGVEMQHTLGELIERAQEVLRPDVAAMTVVGHGDAHFGNVFLEEQTRYLYFDPAFAGRHSPLLDVVKPLFHNIFATWMYFPQQIGEQLHLSVRIEGDMVLVEHDYALTPVRQAILQTKVEHLLTPLIALLRSRKALPDNWLEVMQLALLCCPLLTIHLLNEERIPMNVSWLGLLLAIQMGNTGIKPWRTDI